MRATLWTLCFVWPARGAGLALGSVSCGGAEEAAAPAAAKAAPAAAAAQQPGAAAEAAPPAAAPAAQAQGGERKRLDFSPGGPIPDEDLSRYVVEMEVAIDGEPVGTMAFEFWPEKAPVTVRNFLRYCSEGFYDGLTFHRIIKGFMIQGGCPKGTGTGQGRYGTIRGEFSSDPKYAHVFGVISMARSDRPDSASCQFFICNATARSLDGKYASFGALVSGRKTLERISAVEVEAQPQGELSKPTRKVTIERATVLHRKAWEERQAGKQSEREAGAGREGAREQG